MNPDLALDWLRKDTTLPVSKARELLTTSGAELPQVVIEMFVDEYAPVASTHMTKESVLRPGIVWIACAESLQERFEFPHIRLP